MTKKLVNAKMIGRAMATFRFLTTQRFITCMFFLIVILPALQVGIVHDLKINNL